MNKLSIIVCSLIIATIAHAGDLPDFNEEIAESIMKYHLPEDVRLEVLPHTFGIQRPIARRVPQVPIAGIEDLLEGLSLHNGDNAPVLAIHGTYGEAEN